ncbi:alkane 1-monooxygenase [Pseudomonas sp. BN415]|uniref:alkane 1-monooxygenase n=1 Tax=Pseudomonas sp. BN415 TaxID=2567889 RepID=UPI0024544D35|nr:alkane 1-monooxygenase [Pseudomonas sp. BN415]MDH4585582.1 alkane 1-monooxygenase [Pseudomonas sp. BN415]
MIRNYAYCLALLHPLSVGLGLWMGGNWVYSTVILSAVVYPAVEILTKPTVRKNKVTNLSTAPELLARATAAVVIIVVIITIATIPYGTFTVGEKIVLIYSCGLSTGIVGIVLAHELFHRRPAVDRYLGTALMFLASYPHFKLQHLYSHHPNVATESDHSSAQRGQTIYIFYIRSIFSGGMSVWKKECSRSAIRSNHKYHLIHNRVIALWGIQSLIYAAVLLLLGPIALAVFMTQGIIAIFVLETVNYIQHYGLTRSPHSHRADYTSSWDNYSLTNYALFNLGYHSDHHVNPAKPFQLLSQQPAAPVMPYGYFTMAAVALTPPLWRWMMDERSINFTRTTLLR